MKCPYCLENFNAATNTQVLFDGSRGKANDRTYSITTTICSNQSCRRRIIFLDSVYYPDNRGMPAGFIEPPRSNRRMIVPRNEARPGVVLDDITKGYISDYQEAVDVLPISAKSSAALSRRLLQSVLRDEAHVAHSNLYNEIGQVIDQGGLPSRIATMLDAVREVGNFAAHPIKSTNTGEIVDVEPGEAEVTLDVIELLFDHFFTAPRVAQERIDAINAKLSEAGKPTIEETIAKRQEKINKTKAGGTELIEK